MDRLRTLGIVVAVLTLGAVVIALIGGFQTLFSQPLAFIIGTAMGAVMVAVLLKVALVPERRYVGWTRTVTNRNGRYLFGALLVLWIAGMAGLASLNLDANTVGGFAFLGLFAGFFIFMGFIWAVISE